MEVYEIIRRAVDELGAGLSRHAAFFAWVEFKTADLIVVGAVGIVCGIAAAVLLGGRRG